MGQPYIGEIILVAFNFAPTNYFVCDGRLLPISQYDTLFSLLGTTYGGDGVTTFGLPDLRGRVPIAVGSGQGLTPYFLGQQAGAEAVAPLLFQLPQHTHTIDASGLTATAKCKNGPGNQQSPVGNVPAIEAMGVTATYSNAPPDSNMSAAAIAMGGTVRLGTAGANVPHDNIQPCLAI